MDENTEIEGLVRIDRMANAISKEPEHVRNELVALVAGEQIPGSFGELVKQSIDLLEEHRQFEGTNVVSILGRCGGDSD